ncbi:MAG: phenylalanine 4-monooxygenase [Cytophagaceae bacterium]|jgi:phenylalanine-4-hydroxylase|nr:phenylalanine 4-monooxygenase [Cytophagaceae bacterium]
MNYSEQEHIIWTTLYSRVLQYLGDIADEAVMKGIANLDLPGDRVPDLDEINEKLSKISDWQIVPLEDMVDDTKFIGMLADKIYPCRTWLRSEEQMSQMKDEYDMFHDVMGHTALLYIESYNDYLEQLGQLALEYIDSPNAIQFLKRVYWHTIQYGLIEVNKSLRIYGAHMLTSRNEASYALSAGVPKYDHNVSIIMDTPYKKNTYQDKYFIISSYQQLVDSIPTIVTELKKRL